MNGPFRLTIFTHIFFSRLCFFVVATIQHKCSVKSVDTILAKSVDTFLQVCDGDHIPGEDSVLKVWRVERRSVLNADRIKSNQARQIITGTGRAKTLWNTASHKIMMIINPGAWMVSSW